MDTWYSLKLGDGIQAREPSQKIRDAFFQIYSTKVGQYDMVVFSRENGKTNIITAYFSPSAHEVATLFGATPCKKPSPRGLGFLIGDERAWNIFYPGIEYRGSII